MEKTRLKVRIWDKHTNDFIFFDEGSFHLDDTENTITFRCSPVLGEKDPDGTRFVFQQCTGVRDREGKYIYEGDIIYFEEPIFESGMLEGEVVLFQGSWGIKADRMYYFYEFFEKNEIDFEVVGNSIYKKSKK